jgi:glycosyltransferase involved in cell wall biosynthesis
MSHYPQNTQSNCGPHYPKVLVCALTRINKNDMFNNNLLLRNLFADWPSERLAQIYSGGSNGDEGFCAHQYQIGPDDRRLGKLFFRLKGDYSDTSHTVFSSKPNRVEAQIPSQTNALKQRAGRYLMNSGLYELLFKLCPSKQLIDWAERFDPDVILAQGYNLSFTWLPLLLKRQLKKPIAFYCSDDWPSYLYASRDGLCTITAPLMRWIVDSSTQQLLAATDVPFSFNDMMGEEFQQRYGKHFTPLMHCDDPERFRRAEAIRLHPPEIKSIVATGGFDDSRWPLLLDLEEACQRLNDKGIPARATVLTARITEEGYRRVKACRFVELRDDPGHELLPSYLKGADLLYLPETFDLVIAQGIRYSISTKAHLFMFSQRPILVYGHPVCGLVNYARREKWAAVVSERSVDKLSSTLRNLLAIPQYASQLVRQADAVTERNHEITSNQNLFRQALVSVTSSPEGVKQRGTLSTKPTLVVVSNGITPYGTHFLRRVADELTDFTLRTIYSYEYSMGRWQITLPRSINATIIGKGEESIGHRSLAAIWGGWLRGREVIREIRVTHPSAVMILGYGSVAHFVVIEWCRRNGIPCLMWGDSNIRGDLKSGFKAWIKKILVSRAVSRCDALLPCGSLGAQYFKKYGARSEQIFFVPNEPDYSLIENISKGMAESVREKFQLDPDRHRLVYSGRLVGVKRVDLLIDAFVRVADLRPDWDWDMLIAGDGPLAAELKTRVPNRLQHRVTWTGFLDSPQRMSALYLVSDVLVLPSDYEPWALVVNEAACTGLALVCSDVVGAAAELLRDRENGRLFRTGDITSLVDALRDVTDEANLCRYKAASPQILKRWRMTTDPVNGLRRALDFCLRSGTTAKN